MHKTAVSFLFLLISIGSFSQKIGLVLSGGGASGMAHIGVLKALEENNIPINYITGTSAGALIGSLYASGYTPTQIEAMFKSEEFRNWTYGKIDSKYNYYFKKSDNNASWIQFKVSLNSALETTIPTNVINSLPIDFALMEIFGKPGAASKYNFDSLMIPFRCLASDIEAKQSVVFKNGDLGEAVRSSMSYPFYLRPIYVNNRLMFDGGLYNNFPSDIMYDEFFPDFMIGSNVTENDPPPDDENILSQVRTMMKGKTNFQLVCSNGILIEPQTEVGTFDFDNAQAVIDSGYVATIRRIIDIKRSIDRRVSANELSQKRITFTQKEKLLQFDTTIITGVNKKQQNYIVNTLNYEHKIMSLEKTKKQYYKLAVDDKIKSIFPKSIYNPKTGNYTLYLNTKKEKDLIVYFGGNFSSRPISEGFVAAQYNHLGRTSVTTSANAYFGKLYNSAEGKIRWDIPFKIPFYIEPMVTYNRWDYFKSSTDFFGDVKPAYLIQGDQFVQLNIGTPFGHNAKLIFGGGYAAFNNKYYQTDKFTQQDTADRNTFLLYTGQITYEIGSLNKKMYANEGSFFQIKARYVNGNEYNQPGSTGIDSSVFRKDREWVQLKATLDHYFFKNKKVNIGFYAEGMYSTQPLFVNYSSTILASPAFQPIPESKTFFIESYRAHQYLGLGLKNVISIQKNIDFRLEGYVFLPYQAILNDNHLAVFGKNFQTKHYLASAIAVYHTPVGPLSFSMNYYDSNPTSFSFMFHFGYILFNKRALD